MRCSALLGGHPGRRRWASPSTLALGAWQMGRGAAEAGAAGGHRSSAGPCRRIDRSRCWRARTRADLCTARCVLRGTWLAAAHGVPRQPADARQARLLRGHAAAARGQRAAVLVQRGWVAAQLRRSATKLPPIADAAGRGRGARPHGPASRQAIRLRRGRPRAHPAKSRPGRSSAPKPACRCWTLSVQQTGAAVGRPAARVARRPPAASKNITAMPSSGGP